MRCTFVSTLPFPMSEDKPGLVPAHYSIPPIELPEKFSSVFIDDGYHNFIVPLSDDKAPPMRIEDTGEKICQGLITDYIGANYGVSFDYREDGRLAIPGLFYLKGEVKPSLIKTVHAEKVLEAVNNTHCWFERLIKLADDDWAKYHQHKSISDLQRYAANYLQLPREWNFSVQDMLSNLCIGCKTSVHPEAIICAVCRTVLKPEEFKKLQIAS